MENDFEGIADRVYRTMTKPLTVITTTQEIFKKKIETHLTELKMLMSHAPQVATPSTAPSAIIDPKGNRHRLIEGMPIRIHKQTTQEGLQEGVA